jgi:serine/threonine-protein kinase
VTQVLGAGGFGKTYLAQDTRRPGNPICVVKQLKPISSEPSFLDAARRLFNSEAETLEQLGNHDQIPRLLAYFEEDQEFYLVQEYIAGHTLTQELQPGQRWEESRVFSLLVEILGILDFVHRHGVIHRDIKPDNLIRRDSDKKLVLVDFGAVKQIRTQLVSPYGQASNTIAVGTPGYMASEQALGQPRPSSDIYALGIIGIQALTGLTPIGFQEDLSTGEILWQHVVPVSRGLETVLTKMVRYHFKDRYQSAADALQALQQLNGSHSAAPYPPTPGYSSVNEVPNSGQRLPRSPYPTPPSEQGTMAVSPAAARTPSGPSQSSYDPAPPSNNWLPVAGIGMLLASVVGLGMALALRPGSFASLFGDRDRSTSPESCRVTAGLLNVRSGPGGNVVETVKQGTNLALTGKADNGWVEIRSPVRGWVFNESQYIDCRVARQTPPQTTASQTPVETPTPKPATPKPKPVTPKPKPVDNGSKALAKAADQSQEGDWEKAIAIAKSIPAGSPTYQEAQAKIAQWEQELASAKAKIDKIQKALDEGRWDEVIIAATDPKFFEQRYWRDKVNQLVEEAKKRKAEAEANQQQPTPPESPAPEKPQPEPTDSATPSQKLPAEPPATP